MHVLRRALETVDGGEPVVLATVVEVSGHGPRGPGARMAIGSAGPVDGSVGGGEVEGAVLPAAAQMLAGSAEPTQVLAVPTECGGTVRVFLERLAPTKRLLIVGAGHVGRALAPLGVLAGFAVTVLEPTEREISFDDPSIVVRRHAEPAMLDDAPQPTATQVVVATGSHDADRAYAVAALEGRFASVGVIGSRGKARMIRRAAGEHGLPEARLDLLRCPVGLPIGATTPAEIAIAVVAELIELTAAPRSARRRHHDHDD